MKWNPESHWDNHADYPTEDWKSEVMDGATRQSYIQWVNDKIAEEPMLLIDRNLVDNVVVMLTRAKGYCVELNTRVTDLNALIERLDNLDPE